MIVLFGLEIPISLYLQKEIHKMIVTNIKIRRKLSRSWYTDSWNVMKALETNLELCVTRKSNSVPSLTLEAHRSKPCWSSPHLLLAH